MGNRPSHQSRVNMDPYTTPPDSPSDDDQGTVPPMTMSPRSPRPECLRTAIFWELTDRRHYPPSPGTGLTLFSPVPYPYMPSPMPSSPSETSGKTTTSDGTASPKHLNNTDADIKEQLKETHHENGYPVASSPSSKKLDRATSEHRTNDTHLSHHLSALALHSDPHSHSSTTEKHIARKARIRQGKTIERFEPYRLRERYKDKREANMHQLDKWTDGDEGKNSLVGRNLHARGEERTRGLKNPFVI